VYHRKGGQPFSWRDDRRTIVIVATGPSAGAVQLELTRGWPVLAVNDGWRIVPWAQALYACDGAWWEYHEEEVRCHFQGQSWTQDRQAAEKYGLHYICSKVGPGLSQQHGLIHQGCNSGYQAINLAWQLGAGRFVLVGFDFTLHKGKRHFFGDHPGALNKASPYEQWKPLLQQLADDLAGAGCEVINCSPHTALTCFPVGDLEESL
jgi:hypothetical protein